MLRGNDLESADNWLTRESLKPEPTKLHRGYITSGREMAIDEEKRWKTLFEESETQRRIALARQLAAQSELVRLKPGASINLCALLSIESLRAFHTSEGDRAIRNTLGLARTPVQHLFHDAAVDSVAFSPDGEFLATGSWDNTARIWNVESGEEISRLDTKDRVNDIAISPDGRLLATASGSFEHNKVYTARIWGIPGGEPIAILKHDEQVESIDFSPDGNAVATGSWDKTSRIWDVNTGNPLSVKKHDGHVEIVRFSPDGAMMASGGGSSCTVLISRTDNGKDVLQISKGGYTVKLIAFSPTENLLAISDGFSVLVSNYRTGKEEYRIKHERIKVLEYSSDGKYLITGGMDSTARIWEASNGKETFSTDFADDIVAVATFSPDSRQFAVGTVSGTVSIWDIDSRKEIARALHKGNVHGLDFSLDGKKLATAAWADNSAFVIDVAGKSSVNVIDVNKYITDAAYSPDGGFIAVRSSMDPVVSQQIVFGMAYGGSSPELEAVIKQSNYVDIYDASTGEEQFSLTLAHVYNEISISSDSRYLATVDPDGAIRVRELISGKEVFNVGQDSSIRSLKFRPKTNQLVSVGEDDVVNIWDLESGAVIHRLPHDTTLRSATYTPNGNLLIILKWFEQAEIWDADEMSMLGHLHHEKIAVINDLDFSTTENLLATCATDNTARVWNLSSLECVLDLDHDTEVKFVRFSRDDKHLVTVTDNVIHIWDTNTGVKIRDLVHEMPVTGIDIELGKDYLASASSDKSARIWDIHTGTEALRFQRAYDNVAIMFSPDGNYFTVADTGGAINSLIWRPEDLIEEACKSVTRNMTVEEWNSYFGQESYRSTCSNLPAREA